MKKSDMPGMPIFNSHGFISDICHVSDTKVPAIGMTKREIFALHAMQAIASNHRLVDSLHDSAIEYVRDRSVALADGLLAELEKTK